MQSFIQMLRDVWCWITAREPTATVEMLRQVLPWLIIMGWIHMTETQLAGFFIAISGFLAWVNRQAVTPNGEVGLTKTQVKDANNQGFNVPTNMTKLLVLALVSPLLMSCAKSNAPLDAQTAHYASQVEEGVVAIQTGYMNAYKAHQIPFEAADPVMGYAKQATDVAAQLSAALKVYHAATSPDAQALASADVRAALGKLEELVAKMLKVKVPDGFLDKSLQLIMAVRDAVSGIRAAFPPTPAPVAKPVAVLDLRYGVLVGVHCEPAAATC